MSKCDACGREATEEEKAMLSDPAVGGVSCVKSIRKGEALWGLPEGDCSGMVRN